MPKPSTIETQSAIQQQEGAAVNIGLIHNEALAYFHAHHDIGNPTAAEYESISQTIRQHFTANLQVKRPQIRSFLKEFTQALTDSGMFYDEEGIRYFNARRAAEDSFAGNITKYLVKRKYISKLLADEINKVNTMIVNGVERSKIVRYVRVDFLNCSFSIQERPIAKTFSEVFVYSTTYWTEGIGRNESTSARIKWGLILADALGGAVGFVVGSLGGGLGGPIGGGVGAAVVSSAVAVIQSNARIGGSIGEIHNRALANYFINNSRQTRPENPTLDEYNSTLGNIQDYLVKQEGFNPTEAQNAINAVTGFFRDLNLFSTNNGASNLDSRRFNSKQFVDESFSLLVRRGLISGSLASELNRTYDQINSDSARSSAPEFIPFFFSRLPVSSKDKVAAEAFVVTFQNSFRYWTDIASENTGSRFPWHTILADAIGAAQGGALGGPIGAVVGSVIYSIIGSQFDSAA